MHVYFDLGPIHLPGYGLFIAIGILTANFIAFHILKKKGLNDDDLVTCEIYAGIFSVIGSKLLFIITARPQISSWEDVKDLLTGGWVFYGGLIFALLGVYLAGRIHKIKAMELLETVCFLIPFAHGFGRIGCFMAGCCFGIPYNGPGAVVFPEGSFAMPGVKLFPIQLMEAALLFILSLVVYLLGNVYNKINSIVVYLMGYSIIRFVDEFFRYDSIRGVYGPFSTSQWISAAIVLFLIVYQIVMVKKHVRKN